MKAWLTIAVAQICGTQMKLLGVMDALQVGK